MRTVSPRGGEKKNFVDLVAKPVIVTTDGLKPAALAFDCLYFGLGAPNLEKTSGAVTVFVGEAIEFLDARQCAEKEAVFSSSCDVADQEVDGRIEIGAIFRVGGIELSR